MQEVKTVNKWKKAKAKKDFSLFKTDFQKLLDLSKQAAEILMKVKQTKTPYEALLDNFEPKMPAPKITKTFNQLLAGLKPLIDKNSRLPNRTFHSDSQSACPIGKSTQNYSTHNCGTWIRYCLPRMLVEE